MLLALYKAWDRCPPLAVMVASYLGVKPASAETVSAEEQSVLPVQALPAAEFAEVLVRLGLPLEPSA